MQQFNFLYYENTFCNTSSTNQAISHQQHEYLTAVHASCGQEKTTFPNEKVAVSLGNTRFLH
jgi:hypothetical protein